MTRPRFVACPLLCKAWCQRPPGPCCTWLPWPCRFSTTVEWVVCTDRVTRTATKQRYMRGGRVAGGFESASVGLGTEGSTGGTTITDATLGGTPFWVPDGFVLAYRT